VELIINVSGERQQCLILRDHLCPETPVYRIDHLGLCEAKPEQHRAQQDHLFHIFSFFAVMYLSFDSLQKVRKNTKTLQTRNNGR
jgi:hypothetical protein